MRLRLNYIAPGLIVVTVQNYFDLTVPGTTDWMHHMVEANPDTIFFFTTDTTDIWED